MRHASTFMAVVLLIAAVTFIVTTAHAQREKTTAPLPYSEVSRIFQTNCLTCHAGGHPAAGLRLDTYGGLMKGSTKGPAVLAGDPEHSELIKRLKGISKPRMPKNGPPWLSEDQISLIGKWIGGGALD